MSNEKRVVFINGRGAVVSDWKALLLLVPNSLSIPIDMAENMEIYEFSATFQGLESVKWASFWLKKGDNRARTIGTYFPCECLRKENISSRQAKKEFYASIKQSQSNLRKKIKRSSAAWSSSML